MSSNTIALAPGHVYQSDLGTGIKWLRTKAQLYQGGNIIAEGKHTTKSPWEFWYTLAFAQTFPQVEHWWFRSLWTGSVKISLPTHQMDAVTIMGFMKFGDEEMPAMPWSISEQGGELEIAPAFPVHEVQPVNLPLRLALARMIFGVIGDEIRADTWYPVTSLVKREELAAAFPLDGNALITNLPPVGGLTKLVVGADVELDLDRQNEYIYRLEGVHDPLRTAFCRVQGLKEE
jgi:hypothetical protein